MEKGECRAGEKVVKVKVSEVRGNGRKRVSRDSVRMLAIGEAPSREKKEWPPVVIMKACMRALARGGKLKE